MGHPQASQPQYGPGSSGDFSSASSVVPASFYCPSRTSPFIQHNLPRGARTKGQSQRRRLSVQSGCLRSSSASATASRLRGPFCGLYVVGPGLFSSRLRLCQCNPSSWMAIEVLMYIHAEWHIRVQVPAWGACGRLRPYSYRARIVKGLLLCSPIVFRLLCLALPLLYYLDASDLTMPACFAQASSFQILQVCLIHQISLPQICRVAPMGLEMLLGTAQLISHRLSIGSLPWTLDALIPPPWSFGRLLLGLPRIPMLWNPARFPRY
ncbi:hypothetical protein J3F84DRAFT_142497 [Trichoderma pleuroticola]